MMIDSTGEDRAQDPPRTPRGPQPSGILLTRPRPYARPEDLGAEFNALVDALRPLEPGPGRLQLVEKRIDENAYFAAIHLDDFILFAHLEEIEGSNSSLETNDQRKKAHSLMRGWKLAEHLMIYYPVFHASSDEQTKYLTGLLLCAQDSSVYRVLSHRTNIDCQHECQAVLRFAVMERNYDLVMTILFLGEGSGNHHGYDPGLFVKPDCRSPFALAFENDDLLMCEILHFCRSDLPLANDFITTDIELASRLHEFLIQGLRSLEERQCRINRLMVQSACLFKCNSSELYAKILSLLGGERLPLCLGLFAQCYETDHLEDRFKQRLRLVSTSDRSLLEFMNPYKEMTEPELCLLWSKERLNLT